MARRRRSTSPSCQGHHDIPLFRTTRIGCITVAALVAIGRATLKVNSHVERGAEFTHDRTWEWASVAAVATGDPRLDNNPFFENRMREAVEHQVTRKGYVRSPLA